MSMQSGPVPNPVPNPASSLFSQIDVTNAARPHTVATSGDENTALLRDVLNAQDRTNELLEELVGTMAGMQKQRASELNQWREAHPYLANSCREAAEALSRVQVEFLDRMTEDINDAGDDMLEGEFMLNEFVDRYGPRLAHLNGVIQVLAQLSSVPNPTNTQG